MSRSVIFAALVLFAFGAYEAFDAGLALFRPPQEGPLAELFVYPRWSLTHFLPGFLFMTLVPLQLWARFRNRHRVVHRWSGRIVAACGAFLAVSGTLLPFTMPERPQFEQFFMVIFGVAFLTFLTKAVAAARRRDFIRHREWMIRMFATGLTITTQRLFLPLFIVAGGLSSVERFWIYFVSAGWAGWAVTLGLAEWWIRRTRKVASGSGRKPQERAQDALAGAGL
jgi:uncharacterized membrane protein